MIQLDPIQLTVMLILGAVIALTIFYFIIKSAVFNALKEQNRVIINLLYRMAEKQEVGEKELQHIKKQAQAVYQD